MSVLDTISTYIKGLLDGEPWGEVWPPPPPLVPVHMDGRTAALRVLRRYISELTFYRSGNRISDSTPTAEEVYGSPIPFRIPETDIHIEQPDNPEQMDLPSIAMLPDQAKYSPIGLNAFILEDTRDVYGPGTVLMWSSEYTETIHLEINAGSKAERRGIIVGLEQALTPTEFIDGLKFRMPSYYEQPVCFSLVGRRIVEENAGRGRRQAVMDVEMMFTTCALVSYVELQPVFTVQVDDDPAFEVEVE